MANSNTQFGGFLTNLGVAQQANSAALGTSWNISHMLIGDAGGDPSQAPDPAPKATQTALVRQVYRAQLNALYQSADDASVLVAELVLPPEVGGWWIRELALEDAAGNFIAVASPAPSYKPLLVQGSGRTQTIRMHVVFGNVANIALKIDPSVVLATRDYVDKSRQAHVAEPDPHAQYLRRADVVNDAGQLTWMGAATGTVNALVLKPKSAEATHKAYAAGQRFQFLAAGANTGTVTARINSLAAVSVKKVGPTGLVDLVAGDLRAGVEYELSYDGTYFQLGSGVRSGTKLADYGIGDAYDRATLDGMLVLLASLASPTFTGSPKAPTPARGNSSTLLATTAYVQDAIAQLVASSPAALDTLNELAAALGNDPNFAATVTTALAGKAGKATTLAGYGIDDAYTRTALDLLLAAKAPLASPLLTGTPRGPNAAVGVNTDQLATTKFVRDTLNAYGLGATTAPSPAVTDDLSVLPSGKYYYTSPVAVAAGYPSGMFLDRTSWGANRGYEFGVIPYQRRAFIRPSKSDGTWQDPFELANLDSPAFLNTPTAPTAAPGTSTKQLANTEFVQAALAALVASSPAALDTLNELAAALGNDPNFATTMANALAGKAAKATTLAGYGITNAYTTAQVDSALAGKAANGASYLKAETYPKTETYSQAQVNELFGRTLSKEYTSPQQTVVSGGLITLAHGLGAMPKLIAAELVCLEEDGGYSVGDVVLCPMNADQPVSGSYNGVFYKDASNIYFKMTSPNFMFGRKSTSSALVANLTKWAMVVRAWA